MDANGLAGKGRIDAVAFARDGFLAPVPVFTSAQCALIASHARDSNCGYAKDLATRDRFFFDLATRPPLLALVEALLGKTAILWGVQVIERPPGAVHPWHVDIETAAVEGKYLSVWIGIANTARDTALHLLSGSHRFGKTIQEVQHAKGYGRGEASEETIAAWGREFDTAAQIVQPDVGDGDAIVFDGRLWHSSHNPRRDATRIAVLLQYAPVDAPVRQADYDHMSWPIRVHERQRLPAILIGSERRSHSNWLVNPPSAHPENDVPIGSRACQLDLPLAEDGDRERGWRPYPMFNGPTPNLDFLSCHVSVLSPGKMPHPPHVHLDEEVLIVLDGEAELIISPGGDVADARVERVGAGGFAYYPAYQYHTLRNASVQPVTYLMFKWRGPPIEAEAPLAARVCRSDKMAIPSKGAFRAQLLFEGQTGLIGKFHAHVSEVDPGGGYEAHRDAHDVALLVLSGRIESGGRAARRHGVIFHAAGEEHGLRNPGSEAARYLVFEFHRAGEAPVFPRVPLSWRGLARAARRRAGRLRRTLRSRLAGMRAS